ncbi:hypothetical protein ABID56_001594 [Alkalibacillus flavidus]|uniref:Uncharacterized protein n=1 Tax=Alkalibacillus flavidus TaxID=546021 RepID=A0ABV2KVW1_9BACI
MRLLGWTALIMIVLVSIVFWWTRTVEVVDETYSGVEVQLGPNDTTHAKQVDIHIDGEFKHDMFSKESFTGSITIDGEKHPSDASNTDELTVTFEKEGFTDGNIEYINREQDRITTVGYLNMSDDLSELTIQIMQDRSSKDGPRVTSWTSDDGIIISAPANNGDEAISIANRVMQPVLHDIELK